MTVTHRKAMAIGTKLALGHGVSGGMALLRSRQAILDVATGPDVAAAVMLARLGKALSAVPAAALMRAGTMPAMYAFEPDPVSPARSDLLNFVARRMAAPDAAFTPVKADRPAIAPVREEDRVRYTVWPATNRMALRNGDGAPAPQLTPMPTRMDRERDALNFGQFAGERMQETDVTQPTAGITHAPIVTPPSADFLSPMLTMHIPSLDIPADMPALAPAADTPSPNAALRNIGPTYSMMQMITSEPVPQTLTAKLDRSANQGEQPTIGYHDNSAGPFEYISAAPINAPSPEDSMRHQVATNLTPQSYRSVDHPAQGALGARRPKASLHQCRQIRNRGKERLCSTAPSLADGSLATSKAKLYARGL